MRKQYSFRIPITGIPDVEFKSASGMLLAIGYRRIVIGGRGPYIEFMPKHINHDSFKVPNNEQWRFHSDAAFYYEYRSIDESYVKLYHQIKYVYYADYIPELYYISPSELFINDKLVLIKDEPRSLIDII